MMVNQNLNLQLKLNKSLSNLSDNGPYTPLDQTLKTPVDPPNYFNQFAPQPQVQQQGQQQQQGQAQSQFQGFQPPGQFQASGQYQPFQPPQQSIYSNPIYNESDDILTDVDEFNPKVTKNYSLNFNPNFDHLVMSVYSHILSLPTTTPFSGTIPPSGMVSKVANETMSTLFNTVTGTSNFDQHHVINRDMLNNHNYHPIFLQLIRKRLIELCSSRNNSNRLPLTTSITVQSSNQVSNPYSTNVRQSSISNLSLTELNINQYHENKGRTNFNNLRKQSLTRNNSFNNQNVPSPGGSSSASAMGVGGSSNNWLHVGNLNTIRHTNESTDSLQSMQDYVPQPFINRSGNGSTTTPTNQSFGFNNMMMEYQTPPSSNKSSFSSPGSFQNIQIVQNPVPPTVPNQAEYDEFHFGNSNRSRSSSNSKLTQRPLTINTDNANLQALNSLNGNADSLDSPFMSATTPSEEFSGFTDDRMLPAKISLSEKKRDSLKLKRGIH